MKAKEQKLHSPALFRKKPAIKIKIPDHLKIVKPSTAYIVDIHNQLEFFSKKIHDLNRREIKKLNL